ncbi:MAG: hypothetical protein OEW15_10830 [Nitrospirota bacterium]|nr:hypothetical protein [Nitrospirota bacterium]
MIRTGSRCMNAIRGLVVLAILLISTSSHAAASATTVADQIIGQLVKKFASLETLSFTVKRVTTNKNHKTEEKWRFRYRRPNSIRIDYFVPSERLVLVNDDSLYEYIPATRSLSQIHLKKLPPFEKSQLINKVLAPVAVPGLTIENAADLHNNPVQVSQVMFDGHNAIRMEYSDPKHIIYIDPAQTSLLRAEIFDSEEHLILRTSAKQFTEIFAGFWIPREIQVIYGAREGGATKSVIYLSDYMANHELPASLFLPPTIPNIKAKELN